MTYKNRNNSRNIRTRRTRRTRRKSRKNGKGGKVIASGGFGCVFRPSLKCKNNDKQNKHQSNYITKLMKKKHADSEYNEITKFKSILNHIPNYKDYFLVDGFYLCEPTPLTQEDMKNYKEKCRTLQKDDIKIDNINDSLDKVLALNMPDGGMDVGDFIEENKNKHMENFIHLNNSLIQLLLKGIVPMNKSHIYHCDVKESNVLVKKEGSKLYTRLIDWGLSCEYKPSQPIPKSLSRRPFQYNVPYSIILFNNEFITRYDKFLKKNKDVQINYILIREFVINFILIWVKIRGPGHLKVINSQMKKLFINQIPVLDEKSKESFIEYEFTYHYIIEYISQVLTKYTKNHTIHLKKYFNEVFIKNIDIWGFIMIYIPFISFLYEKYDTLSYNEKKLFHKIKYIIVHFLFETPCDPINIADLTKELKQLNALFSKTYILNAVSDSMSIYN